VDLVLLDNDGREGFSGSVSSVAEIPNMSAREKTAWLSERCSTVRSTSVDS
jgi:hypothetical protein